MARRSRTRRVLKWVGTAACAAGLAAWATSRWYAVGFCHDDVFLLSVARGAILICVSEEWYNRCGWEDAWYPESVPPHGAAHIDEPGLEWTVPAIRRTFVSAIGTWWTIRMPLWCATTLMVCADILLMRDRRRKARCVDPRRPWLPLRPSFFWGSAVASMLLVTLWLASGRYSCTFHDKGRHAVELHHGMLSVRSIPECVRWLWENPPWYCVSRAERFELDWVPHVADCMQSSVGSWWEVNVPLWLPLLVTAIPAVRMVSGRRRVPSGHCQNCGYDLTGNVSGRCPECGSERPPGIDAVCEAGGEISRFPLQAAETVQRCEHRRKHVDVPSEPQQPC
jgi:hypothetical protein